MAVTSPPRTIKDLQPGDHLCCIYETEEEHRELITSYLKRGLEKREKVIYIVDVRTAETVLGYLRDAGVEVEPYLSSGQLSILSVGESYMASGVFDPDGMIGMLADETEKALAEGYSALRVTGEMSWALRGLPGSGRLMEYEAKLNRFFPGRKCLAICQYDMRRFEPSILLNVLSTHPFAVIGTKLFDNFYYVPPDEFLAGEPERATLGHWVSSLRERKANNETLRQSEEKYRTLFESSRDALMTLSPPSWRFTSCNLKALEMFRAKDENELTSVGPWGLSPELQPDGRASHEKAIEMIDTALRDGSFLFEWAHKRFDGEEFPATVMLTRMEIGGETVVQATVRDITEQKAAEEALQRANEELEGYARTVSHDLKIPLTTIALAAEMLSRILEGDMAEDPGKRLGIILDTTRRAAQMADRLLELARSGQAPEIREPVAVSEVVLSVLEEEEELLEDRGVRVSLGDDLGVAAMDPTHAYQLFSNLIGNAIKYNDSENPEIHVSRLGEAEPGALHYLVRDNGPGIPEGTEEEIFLPFRKGANSTDTGIGLSIVDKVVRLYGGRVRAYNDGGACFEFTLPLYTP